MILMTEQELRRHVRKAIKDKHRTIKAYAKTRGVPPYFIYNAMHRKEFTTWLLADIGITVKAIYQVTR